jgi:hypothetical protein
MPRTEIPVQTQVSLYPTEFMAITWTPADPVDQNYYLATGRETLLVRNVSADTNYECTIQSEPDRLGRTGDLTDDIPFGEQRTVKLGVKGWRNQTLLQVAIDTEVITDASELEYAVIRDPA